MRKRIWTTVGYWALMGVVAAWAQENQRAGLWLIATETRIQQPDDTPGNFAGGAQSGDATAPGGGVPVCLTKEMVDRYGVILPPSLRDCDLSNVTQTADTFKADMTCTGSYNGVGSVESTWTDADHVRGRVRFVAKTRDTSNVRALTWIQQSTAVFKGSDCGVVKPRKMPVKQAQ